MRNISRTRKSNRYNHSQKKRASKSPTRLRYHGGVWPFDLLFGKKQQPMNVANTGIEIQSMSSGESMKNNGQQNNGRQNNTITKTLTNTIFSANNSSRPSIIPSIFPSSNNNAIVLNNNLRSNLPHTPSAPPYSTPTSPPYSPLPSYKEPYEPTDPTAIGNTEDPVALSYTPKSRRNRKNRSYISYRLNRRT
jgi:hypothetical protein